MAEKWADKRAQVANPHGDSEVELGFSDEECDGDFKKNPTAKEIVRVAFSKCKVQYICARGIPGSFYSGVSQGTQRTLNGGLQRIRIFSQKQNHCRKRDLLEIYSVSILCSVADLSCEKCC